MWLVLKTAIVVVWSGAAKVQICFICDLKTTETMATSTDGNDGEVMRGKGRERAQGFCLHFYSLLSESPEQDIFGEDTKENNFDWIPLRFSCFHQ